MAELEDYLRRVREIRPGLEIRDAALNREGLLNDVVFVNGGLVFRFAKRDFFYKDPREEARVLRLLRRHVTLPVPEPFYASEDALAYPLIPGEALRRDVLMRLAEDDQQAVADQLAQFFRELHGVPVEEAKAAGVPPADALVSYEGWVAVYARIREKVFPLLARHAREWAAEHFESHLSDRGNFDWEPKMVDTDVPAYHVLFDRSRRRVSGIIDFGCAGLGDPAVDFGVVINSYGESFLERFYAVYPEARSYLKRARFYAGAIELRWVLQGLERGDPFWLAAHIGGARDVKYDP